VAAVFTHSNWVSAIEFGPDGKQLLTASADGTARLSDDATGNMVHMLSHDSAVLSAQFSPDGQWVLTTCADESAHLWEARTGRRITEPLSHAGSWAFFSPDGLRIATVSAQKVVRLWDFVGAPQLPEAFVSAPNTADAARFSPDGKRVAVAHRDGTIRFYDAASARPLSTSLSSRIGTFIGELVFSPDGSRLVASAIFGPAEIWDVKTGKMLAGSIPNASWSAPCFSPDGSRLLTWSISNSARVFDARTGKPVGAPLQHKDRVGAAEFSPDGRLVVTVSADRTRRVWQTETGEPLVPSIEIQEQDYGNGLARFSPDGARIATTDGGILRILETKTGRQLPITIRHVKSISSVEFSRDGRRILTASSDGSARIWDAVSGQPLAPPMNLAGQMKLAGFSPDGSRVFTSSLDWTINWNSLRFWDALTARPIADPLPFPRMVRPQFSPDGLRLLIRNPAGPLIWDLPPSEGAVPDWLPSLAEAIAGTSLEPRSPISDSSRALAALKTRLQDAPENPWTLWGRWLLADPRERTVSPLSKMPFASGIENVLALNAPDFLERLTLLARGDSELPQRVELARNRVEQRYRAEDLFEEFRRLQDLGREAESLAKLRGAADLGMGRAQNELAYRLAISKDDKIRDGKTALEYALKAVESSQRRVATYLDTLAEAYAEVGDFEKAIAVQEEALGLPAAEWEHNTLISHLELFKAGKPIREE
jgi:WD40 repeat protein